MTTRTLSAVKGPKGELQEKAQQLINSIEVKDDVVTVSRDGGDAAKHRAQHGLARTLINNMVDGCN